MSSVVTSLHSHSLLPLLQALADELKVRPMELVHLYRELGCVDSTITATAAAAVGLEGPRTKAYRVSGCG